MREVKRKIVNVEEKRRRKGRSWRRRRRKKIDRLVVWEVMMSRASPF